MSGNLKRMTPEDHEAQVRYWEEVFAETQPQQERIRLANRAFDVFCAESTEENYILWRDAMRRISQPEGFNIWQAMIAKLEAINVKWKRPLRQRLANWIGRYVGW